MPRIHENTLVFGTPNSAPLAMLPEIGAPFPHMTPFMWIDEYEAQVGRHRRQEVADAIIDSAVGLRGKMVDLGARAVRPSFPIADLPAALRPH